LDAQFPQLKSFEKDKLQFVKEFHDMENALQIFHLPLSVEAHDEFQQLQSLMQSTLFTQNAKDSWVFTLAKGVFKPSLVYKLIFQHIDNHLPSCGLWKSKCTCKHKFLWGPRLTIRNT
jgi:hypothetical protein